MQEKIFSSLLLLSNLLTVLRADTIDRGIISGSIADQFTTGGLCAQPSGQLRAVQATKALTRYVPESPPFDNTLHCLIGTHGTSRKSLHNAGTGKERIGGQRGISQQCFWSLHTPNN